ncbi:hypothetical protein CAC42_7025 [Sphaceloma murrayae]|uniref:Stress-response A/B barrel domain-containing protein n=1 Tax=Sphaceloma murrayae TaxID=2082308 RepID=A0A2K1QQM4_9PEZI|nr:hypothetical protein CAC42_7025 [Sphaceloma murrayae]
MSSQQVERVTLFKIADVKAQEEILSKYKAIKANALKDGKTYIVSVKAGHTESDNRNQGFTIVANTTFASQEDFEYYDKYCEAHKALREFAKTVHQGSMMVYYRSVV